jgi:glycosyltransferase involved in cell wall biosynthesis
MLEALSARCARLVTAPSRAIAAVVARRWRLRPERIRVVPNPIDHERFAPGPPELVVPGRIVAVGRLERAKGQDLLIEALPAVARAAPEAHLWLIGDDGGLGRALRARAHDLGVSDRVTFAGARPREELPELLRTASLCAVPSRFEAFPYTCLEAMACGRAVVAADTGGLPEALGDAREGVLVPPEDPAALAAALGRLLLDADARRALGEAARRRVLSHFAAPVVAAQMAQLYEEARA